MRPITIIGISAFIGALGVAVLTPQEASACGGTFCDTAPTSMPVDQTGETIAFVLDAGYVEAHIQIQYDGEDADRFAWILPLPQVPEIEVGAWRFFDALLAGTVPVYGMTTSLVCDDDSGAPPPGGFITSMDAGGGPGQPPQLIAQETVGAFQYAVLAGGTVDGLVTWLDENGYAPDPAAAPILEEYLDEGMVFVAFKLQNGQDVEDIHPIVVRYPGYEPCIPLRLTRIAAKDDMDVRAFFLGEARTYPVGYSHVLLNRTRLDWPSFGANYPELVGMAIDEAGGRAFVTEYAGDSDVVSTETLDTSLLDPSVFVDMPPQNVVGALEEMELMLCLGQECSFGHELVLGMLRDYLPAPQGVAEGAFYSCLSCWAELIDQDAWDGAAFAAAFEERIRMPLSHARELLTTWPYVTRMYMRISPHEMLSDPLFIEMPGPDVPNLHGAQRNFDCCGTTVRLPGGRVIALGDDQLWPAWSDTMPWAERIEEVLPNATLATLENHTALIDQLIAEHNAQQPCGVSSGEDTSGGLSGGDGTDDPGGPPGATTGMGTTDAGDSTSVGAGQEPGGCGCRNAASAGARLWWACLLIAAARRRSPR